MDDDDDPAHMSKPAHRSAIGSMFDIDNDDLRPKRTRKSKEESVYLDSAWRKTCIVSYSTVRLISDLFPCPHIICASIFFFLKLKCQKKCLGQAIFFCSTWSWGVEKSKTKVIFVCYSK